ncbi:helix-turn-helix domain-containing protein [Faecalibacterium sp. An121]|uniref:helix-turn-helix domain-containing protein n=1 Tax=Faecalibacterium sp. An121 TaxID=1965550 RepID=UPI000B3A15BC|nr:hypothetical protein B5E66_09480 [Faecalibacterium sp. An121]
MNDFPKHLRTLRIERNMTQNQLASMLNYSREAVVAWERGRKLPSYDAIIGICKCFDVSSDWLLGLSY